MRPNNSVLVALRLAERLDELGRHQLRHHQKRGQVDLLSEPDQLHGPSQDPVLRRPQAHIPPAQNIQLNQ
jgi:hypothetical protein